MFQIGDVVTCIDCAEEHGFYNPVTHQYKIPIPDNYVLLTLGENYTVLSIHKQIHDVAIFEIITLEELLVVDINAFFTKHIFKADRFVLNVTETRKKKINSLDIL
jgi:hypothetical protein